uniref:Photosystem I P700 chlorophyll a apoprotein A1 PSI-A PsaA n=1 Tax=Rhizophora mucronata TaxID=61149 RepID=A0A2P2JT90_RHIMU
MMSFQYRKRRMHTRRFHANRYRVGFGLMVN